MKQNNTVLISLVNNPDSIAANEVIRKYIIKNAEYIRVKKSATLKDELTEIAEKGFKTIVFVGFVPREEILKEIKSKSIKVIIYHNENILGSINEFIDEKIVFTNNSLSMALFMEYIPPKQKIPNFVNILENVYKYKKKSSFYQTIKTLNYKKILKLLEDKEQDINCFYSISESLNRYNVSIAEKLVNNYNIIEMEGIKIPVINSFKQQNEYLSNIFLNCNKGIEYGIVGFYSINRDLSVQMSLRSSGEHDLKALYKKFKGSGNMYAGGFTLSFEEFSRMMLIK